MSRDTRNVGLAIGISMLLVATIAALPQMVWGIGF